MLKKKKLYYLKYLANIIIVNKAQVCHINQKFNGFVYNLRSLIQTFTIYVGVYLTASPLQHRQMWWVCDKLLLLHLFGLVLLWLYVIGINSTIPTDYSSPKKAFSICRVSWYFFPVTL